MQSDSVNSVDLINDQFDEYQSLLSLKEKKLRLLVDFSDSDECDKLISLLGDIKKKEIVPDKWYSLFSKIWVGSQGR